MMGISAKQYQSRLSPLLSQSKLKEIVTTIVLSDQERLKERKVNEFTQGERPNGEKIGEYSSSSIGAEYAFFKNRINPLAGMGNVDLMLTRSFTNKMFVIQSGKGYIFNSSDNKRGNLIAKYGTDIMGLNQDWFNNRQSEIYRITLLYLIKQNYNIG